ncbi:MAG: NAD(P)/FAD-dependent oxidoreductase [bacterium]
MDKRCVIIGASHAGSQLAISLRQAGWPGPIDLIGAEADYPYQRPPLSKEFLSGTKTLDEILIRPPESYKQADIQFHAGVEIAEINREQKTLLAQDGTVFPYDKLAITTGARVRPLPIPGATLKRVFYLRDKQDVLAISKEVAAGKSALIIGGGYIGLETAASLTKQGMEVTLLEAETRILQRVTAPEISDFYRQIHRQQGVQIFESTLATQIIQEAERLTVLAQNGQRFSADIIIIGIGVIPNSALAEQAGLEVTNGIVVDEYCQTQDACIFAAGDVTWHYNPIYGRRLRLESVPNATEQAKIVAANMMGKEQKYNALPWFWSDQFDLKLQIAGLSEGYDNIVMRGSGAVARQLSVFYFYQDRLLAVDAVNDPRAFMLTKMALMKGQGLDKEILADEQADLKSALID